jgi:hypothetical protein
VDYVCWARQQIVIDGNQHAENRHAGVTNGFADQNLLVHLSESLDSALGAGIKMRHEQRSTVRKYGSRIGDICGIANRSCEGACDAAVDRRSGDCLARAA